MADLTKEQQAESDADVNALIYQDQITREEWNKLEQYNSDKAVVGGMYRLTSVSAIKKVGPTSFKVYDVKK